MRQDCLLLISSTGLRAWTRQRGSLAPGPHFSADAAGHTAFSEWLADHPAACFTVLADLPGESLRVDTIPHSRGRDRTSLVARRCRQHFPDTRYTAALPLETFPGAPPRETILLSALMPAELVDPWMERMAAQRCAVRSLHGMGFALDLWVCRNHRRQPALRGDFLLVSTSPAGERHSYFQHGRLRFSRLVGDSEDAPLQRSEAYLYAHDLTDRRTALTIIGFGVGNLAASHTPAPPADVGIPALFQTISLPPPSPDAPETVWLDTLHRLLTRRTSPANTHAPAEVVRPFRTRQMLTGLGLLSAALGTAALFGAVGIALSSRPLVLHNAALAAQLAANERTLKALHADAPATPRPPAELRAIAAELDRQGGRGPAPREALTAIAAVLDRHPQAVLHHLHWEWPRQDDGGTAPLRVTLTLGLDASDDPAADRLAADLARQPGARLRRLPAGAAPRAALAGHIRLELEFLEPA